MAKPKFENIPAGSVVLSLAGALVLISEAKAAELVSRNMVFLCDNCPAYHVAPAVALKMAMGAALDLRELPEAMPADPELAAKLAEYGKTK